ncbi:MAG TPA: metallophosphoesterase [Pyrinomonadaceae bacterium]|jgi:orotate phosphoribosyltransferase|nr:metallophosphoesterase [Pyrinomonadaceae bacterium]
MDAWQVLHITDFHINAPNASGEHLRTKYYKEYLQPLAEQVLRKSSDPLDLLVITGDFVDRGLVDNFDHASTVVDYLASQLNISTDNIVVCNGNHDIVRAEEEVGNFDAARQAYKAFARNFANKNAIQENKRAALCKLADGLSCLMIDATLVVDSTTVKPAQDTPGDLTEEEADDLMEWIKPLPKEEVLIIGSHFPVHDLMVRNAPFDEDEPDWAKRHVWQRGALLRERLHRWRARPHIVWLCGDIHKSVNIVHDGHCFISTGRLGTRTDRYDSQIPRQARLIQIPKDGDTPKSLLIEYKPVGHYSQAQIGDWESKGEAFTLAQTIREEQEIAIVKLPEIITGSANDQARPSAQTVSGLAAAVLSSDTAHAETLATTESFSEMPVELIDGNLQQEIIKTITDLRLYHFGRFTTSQSEVSLSWVSIGPLLKKEILSQVISHMAKSLRKLVGSEEDNKMEKTVLIGFDCWGAVLASQLSVLTGARNFCVAMRAEGKHSVSAETVSEEVLNYIKGCDTVVLVSDVVASGRSLRSLYKSVKDGLGDSEAERLRWFALSIICDRVQPRRVDCSFLTNHSIACVDLRMPVLPYDALPEESVLPPIISFQ